MQGCILIAVQLMLLLYLLFGLAGVVSVVLGVQNVRRNRTFSLTPLLYPLGIFVWGDAPILGAFWVVVAIAGMLVGNMAFFLLCVSLFWCVRSVGETIYWLLQQFSPLKRNPPEQLFGYRFVKDESIWFMYQLFWQCMTVVSLIFVLYFAFSWRTITAI